MEEYLATLAMQYTIEIGDYIWSKHSHDVQGEVFSIVTMQQRKRTLVTYHVQRSDACHFVIFASDVKLMQKSETWYAKLVELAQTL